MSKIREDVTKTNSILDRWQKNIGPGGVKLRFDWVAQTLFALGSSEAELKKLADTLDRRKAEITSQMQLMFGLGWGVSVTAWSNNRPVSPSPRQDVNILFVDGDNESECGNSPLKGDSAIHVIFAKLVPPQVGRLYLRRTRSWCGSGRYERSTGGE